MGIRSTDNIKLKHRSVQVASLISAPEPLLPLFNPLQDAGRSIELLEGWEDMPIFDVMTYPKAERDFEHFVRLNERQSETNDRLSLATYLTGGIIPVQIDGQPAELNLLFIDYNKSGYLPRIWLRKTPNTPEVLVAYIDRMAAMGKDKFTIMAASVECADILKNVMLQFRNSKGKMLLPPESEIAAF